MGNNACCQATPERTMERLVITPGEMEIEKPIKSAPIEMPIEEVEVEIADDKGV